MKKRFSVYVMLFAAISLLSIGCGRHHGDGGGGGDTVTVTADKRIALANGSEDITLTAHVANGSGTALPGKAISFAITSGTGTLHAATATTDASGNATVQLNRGPISPLNKEDVTVTATVDTAAGSKTVRFIDTPASATIQVAIDPPISNLAILTFDLISSPTQSTTLLSIDPINEAVMAPFVGPLGPGTQNTFASILSAPNTFTLFEGLPASTPGITTVLNSPIVGFVFAIDSAITALPTYVIGPDHITASNPSGLPLLPALTQSNFVATVVFDTEL